MLEIQKTLESGFFFNYFAFFSSVYTLLTQYFFWKKNQDIRACVALNNLELLQPDKY